MCVFFIFSLFLVSLALYVDIYIVKRRRPRFVGGAIEISLIDWLIDRRLIYTKSTLVVFNILDGRNLSTTLDIPPVVAKREIGWKSHF